MSLATLLLSVLTLLDTFDRRPIDCPLVRRLVIVLHLRLLTVCRLNLPFYLLCGTATGYSHVCHVA